MSRRKDCKEMLQKCATILGARSSEYGEHAFERAAVIAETISGRQTKPFDIALALLSTKLARYHYQILVGKRKQLEDTVLDAMNYLALMERERDYCEQAKGIPAGPKQAHEPGDGSAKSCDISTGRGVIPKGS